MATRQSLILIKVALCVAASRILEIAPAAESLENIKVLPDPDFADDFVTHVLCIKVNPDSNPQPAAALR